MQEQDDDFVLDSESGEILDDDTQVTAENAQAKLKNLREKLRAANQEKQDYLTGWQRAKADLLNYQRTAKEESDIQKQKTIEKLVLSLLPVVDSFDMAMQGQGWQNIDPAWRLGVEQIASQLQSTLRSFGLESFGTVGETFSPHLHESIDTVPAPSEKEDHTISSVLQRGYKLGEKIVRPAKVIIAIYEDKN